MVLRHTLEQVRGEPVEVSPMDDRVLLRRNVIEKGRPLDVQLLRIALRRAGAIREDEIAQIIAQNNGYVQYTCHRGPGDDCDYVDPPVVTVHADGTWERV